VEAKKRLIGQLQAASAAAILGLGLVAPAGAVTINQGLTPGVLNTIEDQDREAYVDVDADGNISVGDVFVGFARIDNFLPSGDSANNQVYAIFSNQITGFNAADPTLVSLGTTTVVGLRLQDITGDANATGGIVAVYDRGVPFSANLINTGAPGATDLKDDNDLILAEGTLRLVVGLGAADTYWTADTVAGFGVGSSNATIPLTPTSVTIGSFVAGLDVLFNNTAFTYDDAVVTLDPLTGLQTTQLGIANGALRGAIGDGNEAVFTNVSGYGAFTQCDDGAGGSVICGFVSDADFFVVAQAPEPGSLALLGVVLVGLAGIRRRFMRA
jgi:hypothetical protein